MAAQEQADPRQRPLYSIGDAARYLHVAPATLRSWVVGRHYPTAKGSRHWPRVIRLADEAGNRLSFSNLVETHVLRSLRGPHSVSMRDVRQAIAHAERQYGIKRLLLSPELCTAAGRLFLDRYTELIELSASGQLAMRVAFEKHLGRIDRDQAGIPARLFPFTGTADGSASRTIAIDPRVSSGRPIIERRGIRTALIVDRLDAGESPQEIAADYHIEEREVIEAVTYERAA